MMPSRGGTESVRYPMVATGAILAALAASAGAVSPEPHRLAAGGSHHHVLATVGPDGEPSTLVAGRAPAVAVMRHSAPRGRRWRDRSEGWAEFSAAPAASAGPAADAAMVAAAGGVETSPAATAPNTTFHAADPAGAALQEDSVMNVFQ